MGKPARYEYQKWETADVDANNLRNGNWSRATRREQGGVIGSNFIMFMN